MLRAAFAANIDEISNFSRKCIDAPEKLMKNNEGMHKNCSEDVSDVAARQFQQPRAPPGAPGAAPGCSRSSGRCSGLLPELRERLQSIRSQWFAMVPMLWMHNYVLKRPRDHQYMLETS